jgi:hypothetical protein
MPAKCDTIGADYQAQSEGAAIAAHCGNSGIGGERAARAGCTDTDAGLTCTTGTESPMSQADNENITNLTRRARRDSRWPFRMPRHKTN